ncbi:MAG: hypothetical protein K0S32_1913 [Bacteroidetes bacterium]|jgi:hypothetical protein|nr:hypothetical protein [Bacteroidota bacterium]
MNWVNFFLVSGFFLLGESCNGQSLSTEMMSGNNSIWYQHTIVASVGSSGVGFFNTSSFDAFYYKEKRGEVMAQSYLTYQPFNKVKLGLGAFYSSVPGFYSSVNIQLFKFGNNYTFIFVPRIDLAKKPTYDFMFLAEYKPRLSEKIKLYARFQTMMNYGDKGHNRSYQYVRFGLEQKTFQFGVAANYDCFGREMLYVSNYGLFIRKEMIKK